MFSRRKARHQGVELPDDFHVSSIINNIAISNDGRYAAVTRTHDLIVGPIPDNGVIEVDGTTIRYKKSSGGINVSGGTVRMSSVGSYSSISGSSISIGGPSLEYEIDESYEGIARLALKAHANDINLGLSPDGRIYVRGLVSEKPHAESGILSISDFEGSLLLPQSASDLEQDVQTMSGDISVRYRV